jgi:hypothetical protein
MNSIVKIAKQTLSTVVVGATILWSMGASLLVGTLTAHAAPVDGSLIKTKEFDSVYYFKGGQRWVFPNLKTYKSWYKDFSTVQVIPRAELETYPVHLPGSNVVYRAGTRLVKITTDPRVFAVEPGGKLRWISSEATAKALYGNDWAKRVDDVPDAFFTNYNVGADLTGTTLPDGSLVKSGADYYYIAGGMKRAVSAAGLVGNNFNTAYAIALTDTSAYAMGAALGDTEMADTAQSGAAPSTVPGTVVSGALTISLASDSPAGTQSIVVDTTTETGGQRLAKMAKVNFTAGSAAVNVTKVTAKRLGVSKDADVDNLYLADVNGKILAKNLSFSAGAATFSGALFTVPAGQTASVWILEDVNKSSAAGSTQGWSVDASGVSTSGNGSVTGSASGYLFTVASVSDLAQLEVATSSPVAAATVDAGKVGYTLGTFKVKAVDQEMLVKSVKFTQIGTIATTDLKNVKLNVAGIQYGATQDLGADNTLSFDFSGAADGGIKLLAGQTKFMDLVGDIVGGTNRTFAFSIQNQEDVQAYDNAYKVFVPVYAGVNYNGEAFTVQTLSNTTVNTGNLSTSIAVGAPNGNVALNASSVTVARFNLSAAGENVKITGLSVTSTASDYTDVFKNVKLMLDGTQVGSTATTLTAGVANAYTFSNNFTVKVGTPSVLEVVADLNDSSLAANSTFSFGLVAGSSNAQGIISLASMSTGAVNGNTLTLKSGAPTVSANSALVDATVAAPSGVINDTDVKIGSFVISAGAGEGAKITSLSLEDNTVALNGLFSNLRIRGLNAAGQYGDLAPGVGNLSGSGSTYSFSLPTALTLTKGQQYVMDVVANVLSTTSSSAINTPAAVIKVKDASVAYQTLETAQSNTITTGATGKAVYIVAKGTLTAAVSADTPVAQQLVMGATNQPILKFKLTAGKSEDLSVTELAAAVSIMASTTPTGILSNIRLLDGDAQVGSAVAALTAADASATVATSTAYAKFSALSITVPKNTSKTYTLVADVAASPDIYSGLNFTAYLVNGYDQSDSLAIVAKGAKSGAAITASGVVAAYSSSTVRGNVLTTYKTKLTVAHAANAPSGASSKSATQTVAKFVVSNSANVNNQAADISSMDLSVATSISQAAGNDIAVSIYKTESLVSSNLLISTSLVAGGSQTLTLGASRSEGANALFIIGTNTFTTVSIEPGTSQTFTVVMETSDASANNTLTVGLAAGDLGWSDGYSARLTSVDSLPLTGKTLTY